jgi:hypothetical protein
MSGHDRPFYGKKISRHEEQEHIQRVVDKYRMEPADEKLHEKVYNELMFDKYLGKITIPFRVVLQKDPTGIRRPYIDILLDTKV